MSRHAHSRNPEGSRARVLEALRRGPRTLEQLVQELGLTRTAVRLHLTTLERDAQVARRGLQAGRTKPSQVYELTTSGEADLSRAYLPVLTELLRVLSERLTGGDFQQIMRDVGRGLVADQPRPRGTLLERANAASDLLDQLGGLTEVHEDSGKIEIRSFGCPLAAAATNHAETCAAMETLVGEYIGARVTQRCDRSGRPRCCFEIEAVDAA